MKRLVLALLLFPPAICHASPSPSDSLHSCLFLEPEQYPPVSRAAGKRLADLDAGEPRTVRLFYFLPNDRPYRSEVVQRTRDEMLRIQAWFGEQMEAHGYGNKTFRIETDADGEPVVHRVDGQHPDSHYLGRAWDPANEIREAFDLSQSIIVVVVDNSTNRIGATASGAATWRSKQSGIALVGGDFAWDTMAHELAHTFGMGHDYRDDRHILSYGYSRNTLSACSAAVLAVHPYFNPDVGVEWAEAPAIELLSAATYPEGVESVPIRLKLSDAHGLQLVRVRVRTRRTHDPRYRAGGTELKTCRALMGEQEALVEIEYDGVIPSGAAWSLSDLSDPKVHPILLTVVDNDGNRATTRFDLWELSRQHLATFELGEEVQAVAFAGVSTLVSGSAEGVELWDLETRTGTTTSLSAGVTAVAVSPDGATLASGSASGQVQLLDLEGDRVAATLPGHTQAVRSLAFSLDGTVLASGGQDGVRLWDVEARSSTATLPGAVTSVALSPDGATLASGSGDGLRLLDVETEAEVATYQHGSGGWGSGVNSVAFSPDGTLVASGGDDTTVRLWEMATGDNVAVLEGHDEPVRSVAFSTDGTMLASGDADLTVLLWDPVSGERLADLRGEGREVNAVAFSPDGATLAAGTEDGRIGLWSLAEWAQPRPQRLVLVSGDDQQGTIGESLADPLVVEVRDQYGNPLPGVEVAFAVVQGDGKVGGQFTVERTTSDAGGRAEALLTLGPMQGANAVEVSVEGIEVLSFTAAGVGEPGGPRPGGDFRTWQLPDASTVRLGKGLAEETAFLRNGEVLAVGTQVGIWLYDVATSREIALLPTRRIWDMAVSHDGRILASCGAYKDKIRLWEVATGEEITTVDQEGRAVALSPDGRTLASSSGFGIELWDVETGSQVAAISGEGTSGIEALAFSPDGRLLAAGEAWSGTSVHLWDLETATRTATLEGHKDRVNSLVFSPDGRTVASASHDHTVKLWDVASESIVTTFEGHTSWVFSVDFSPDGTLLASASDNIKLWDLDTGESTTFSLRDGTAALRGFVDFSPDGRTLAAGSLDGVTLLEVATGNAVRLATGHTGGARAVALSPDGTRLASARGNAEVHLWDVVTGRVTATLRGHTGGANSVDFSPDGATLASGASDRTIKLWDVATGAETATLEATGATWVRVVAFSGDGTMIASGHGNGTARIWDLATGEPVATLKGGHTGAIESVALSPDGSRLATAGRDGRFLVWDLASRTTLVKREQLGHEVYVSFNAAGTALAFGADFGSDQKSTIWEVPAGADVSTQVVEYPEPAAPAVFSPDGSIFIVGSSARDGVLVNVDVLEVRDVATADVIATLEGHGDNLRALAVSNDGSTFASGSTDGTILVWDLRRVLPHPRSLTGLSGADQDGLPNAALGQPFVIEVRDQHGGPLEGATVAFAVTGGGGTLSVETATTDERGQAATTLTLGLAPGPNTIEVTAGDLEPVIFTAVTQAVPTTLSIVGGDAQQGASGASLPEPLVVSLLDQVGSPMAGAAVTFAVTAGEGTLSVTRATTDAQGRAAASLTLGRTPGANSVEVTVAGLAPVTFTALGVAVPQTLTKLSGDEQAAEPGEQLPEPLVISVLDQNGQAYPGAVVTFALTGDRGTLSSVSDTTDAEGRATTTLTLGEEYGTYAVVATVADLEPLTFTAAARASPDFDGDGEVGFPDFFVFAEAFGGSDPRFDLDGSGTVDFADFFLFAEHFGQPARAKLEALARELIGLPDGPQLRQNAPNPFNSGTVIVWFQLQPGPVRLEVFTLTGQRVAVLSSGHHKAGYHRLHWDGRDDQGRPLASGTYLYQLATAEKAWARKLTLLR